MNMIISQHQFLTISIVLLALYIGIFVPRVYNVFRHIHLSNPPRLKKALFYLFLTVSIVVDVYIIRFTYDYINRLL